MVKVKTPTESFSVSHLPPVALIFTLPPTYPSESPPDYELQCRWMTKEQESVNVMRKRLIYHFAISS